MAKYIDADLLRAENKELTLFYAGQANLLADTTTLDGFDEVLSIIDSLQQEQPEVDLEKEYKEYVEDDPVFSTLTNRNVGLVIAMHFYELGLNARKED